MKLQFRRQKFQADAAKAVVDVFAGQPYLAPMYTANPDCAQQRVIDQMDFSCWRNEPVVPELSDAVILEHLNKIQRTNQIEPSSRLEGRYNLTVEMETGVGKTYTYIKTMFELNKHYGWSKFIVVVPSIAIREGVYKSFQVTQEHFAEDYGKKIQFFIYNSGRLAEVERFASSSSISVMIINSQAFNARGKDARRIYLRMDEFRSRRPIDIIAGTNPILIIDEPQSVEGRQTKERLKEFHPLMTLRYSATHRKDSIYNLVYRLDAVEAYNKHLVKKISVKGITRSGTEAAAGFVYLESVNLSKDVPAATIQFDCKGRTGIRKKTATVKEGYSLYENSGLLDEYQNRFVVKKIDGRDNSLEFLNGLKIYAGDVTGDISEEQIRRIQIRETILSHIERERQLFARGVKVLSLFFIDEVAKYRQYDGSGQPVNGVYADMFEEEYRDVVENLQLKVGEEDYIRYLDNIQAELTHAGYFSVDKKGKMTDSHLGDRRERTSDDTDAYDLIMKNKELLLERDPKKSPVRFLFSHSALREGWDNPNVFQICTLKQSGSDVRKRQEVGRGLRLCVNQAGERMDTNLLGESVHSVNVLTVIASESYDSFARELQCEIAEAVANRPRAVAPELFMGKVVKDVNGDEQVLDAAMARAIIFDLIVNGYIDRKGVLTDKYYSDRARGQIRIAEEAADSTQAVVDILDSVYNARTMQPENGRVNNVELCLNEEKLNMPEFQDLWSRINRKSVYEVHFDEQELERKTIDALNRKLRIAPVYFKVESGAMESIQSRDELTAGGSFQKESSTLYDVASAAGANIRYDLIGRLVEETSLTRKAVAAILRGIDKNVFGQFKENPEDFILRAAALINDEKAAAIISHITYHVLDEKFSTDIFTKATIKGKLDVNATKTRNHLYDHVVYDSANELDFAKELETNKNVAVYVKLPSSFFISTPVGRYHPDWAIAFYAGTVKHVNFVAETKGSTDTLTLNHITPLEQAKIACARAHFKALSGGGVVYEVVDRFDTLLDIAKSGAPLPEH